MNTVAPFPNITFSLGTNAVLVFFKNASLPFDMCAVSFEIS